MKEGSTDIDIDIDIDMQDSDAPLDDGEVTPDSGVASATEP